MKKDKKRKTTNEKKPEEYDYRQIISLGKSFLDAANRCNEPSIEAVGWSHHFIAPIITNMAFACELFLKAILKQENKLSKRHELIVLFNNLSVDCQVEIMGLEHKEDFIDKLKSVSIIFVEWRYIYEYPIQPVQYKFLRHLSERLLLVVDKL